MEKALRDVHLFFKLRIRLLERLRRADGDLFDAMAGRVSVPKVLRVALKRTTKAATDAERIGAARAVFPEGAEGGLADRLVQQRQIEKLRVTEKQARRLMNRLKYVPHERTLRDWWLGIDEVLEDGDEVPSTAIRADARAVGDVSSLLYLFGQRTYGLPDIHRLISNLAWDGRIGPLDAAAMVCTLGQVNAYVRSPECKTAPYASYYVNVPFRTGAAKIIQRAWRTWRRAKAARTIQRAWRRAISDPERLPCKKRLMREFAEWDCRDRR